MLAVKFKRIGKKKQASFRVVVAEKKSKLRGKPVEDLGWLNPRSREHAVNKERVLHWLKVGAKATPSVHNFLVKSGIIKGKKIPVHKKTKKNEKNPSQIRKEAAPEKEKPEQS